MIKPYPMFLVFGLFPLVGCGPSEPSKQQNRADADAKILKEQTASEQKLIADPSRAAQQLVQRLRASVKMINGVLVVDDQSTFRLFSTTPDAAASIPDGVTLSVFPRATPWVVYCGIGIKVVFGNPISGESEQVVGDGKVWLTTALVPRQTCKILAPMIGKEIHAIVGEE